MKLYQVEVDLDAAGWLLPKVPETEILKYCVFDCSSRKMNWKVVEWTVFDKSEPVADFYTIGNSGAFVLTMKVFESKLRDCLEQGGELLPLLVEGETMYLFNATTCLPDITHLKEEGNLFPASLFKTADVPKTRILTVDDGLDDSSFYNLYNTLRMNGLFFKELGS